MHIYALIPVCNLTAGLFEIGQGGPNVAIRWAGQD
jgi:hypothetical protein